jgi:hypothetical protein
MPTQGRATSFNLAEQCVVKEIVAEGNPEHFSPDVESFFRHGGFSQEGAKPLSSAHSDFPPRGLSVPGTRLPQNTRPETSADRFRLSSALG